MTYDDLILKEADLLVNASGIISGILTQVKGMVDFKNRPFETIFGIMGTGAAFALGGWLLGSLIAASELIGYGPGYVGSLIDKHFGLGDGKTIEDADFSQSNVEGAAEATEGDIFESFSSLPDKIQSRLKSIFSSVLSDIREIKGELNANDINTAFYATMYAYPIVKTAKVGITTKMLEPLARILRGGRRTSKGIFSGILMKIIWAFVKGMMALGIGGGIASAVGYKTKQQKRVEEEMGGSREDESLPKRPPGLKHYSNVDKNVKRTLITFLNAAIANFGTGFMQAQRLANPNKPPIPMEQAPGWTQVLGIIQKYNWAPMAEINDFSAFVAPSVQKVAQILLSSVNVSGVKIEKMEPISKLPKKPFIKSPTGVKPPVGDDRLRQLLQGEART